MPTSTKENQQVRKFAIGSENNGKIKNILIGVIWNNTDWVDINTNRSVNFQPWCEYDRLDVPTRMYIW